MKKLLIVLLAALSTGLLSDAKKICNAYDKQPAGAHKEIENNIEPVKCDAATDVFDFSQMSFFLFI